MKKKMKKILAFLCAVVLFVTAVFTENAMNQAQAETETSTQATSTEPTPVELYGFENVTIDDFNHYQTNNIMTEGDYRYGVTNFYKLFDGSNLDKKLFTAYIKFSYTDGSPWDTRIHVGGSATNTGLAIFTNANGTELTIKETNTDATKMVGEFIKNVSNTDVGVGSFKEEFLLQIGYEYGDFDSDNGGTADDVRVLVYVEGTEVCKDYIKDANTSILGGYIHLDCGTSTSVITVSSVHNPVKPDEVSGFTNRTVGDFVYEGTTNPMEEKTYVSTDTRAFMSKDGENFDKKLFTANVQFNNPSGNYWDTRLYIGGAWTLKGLAVCVSTDGTSLILQDFSLSNEELSSNFENKSVTATEAGVISFKDEFLLQVGYEYLDKDSDGTNETVRALVFVNGKRVLDETIENCNMNFLGNYVGIYTTDADESVKISSFQEEVKPVTLSSYDTVTISDFQDSAGKEMESKAYDYDGTTPSFSLKDGSADLRNKLLSMKVKFGYRDGVAASYETRVEIPTPDGSWGGIWMFVDDDGNLHLNDITGTGHNETINCAKAGVSSFKNIPFIFQISFTNTSAGLEVGVYINGTLYTESYSDKTFLWTEDDATVSAYGAKLNLNRGIENSFITVSDVDAKEFPGDPLILPDSTFEKITFGSFGYTDGTYSSVIGTYSESSVNQRVLCGNIKLEGDGLFQIILGGKDSEWDGLRLMATSATTMEVKWFSGAAGTLCQTFTSDDAGVEFIGQSYNLMISMEVVDANSDGTNDIRYGVWFEDQLCGGKYDVVYGVGDTLGSKLGIYGPEGGTVTLGSVKTLLPQPDASYNKVTFKHFGIDDGTYTSATTSEFVVNHDYLMKNNLDKVVLCGDVLLTGTSDNTFVMCLGGTEDSPKQGLWLWICGANMVLNLGDSSPNIKLLNSNTAGVGDTFAGNEFSFMWSMEFACIDNDGVYNDIKVGFWFNGFFYENQYIYIRNGGAASDLGNVFSVSPEVVGTSATLNSESQLVEGPSAELGKLSLPDFVHNETTKVMESGTYFTTTPDDFAVKGYYGKGDTLAGKVVSTDILLTGEENASTYQLRIGGKDNTWYGLALNTDTAGQMWIRFYNSNGTEATRKTDLDFSYMVANADNPAAVSSFWNTTFNLTVSFELVEVNDNDTPDVKVRIWFNEIPWSYWGEEEFYYLDCGNELGNQFGVYIGETDAKESVSLRTVAEYQSNPYYYEDISEYRQGTRYVAPGAPEGYVFSGWYTDEDYKTPIARDKTNEAAYAKFVEADVLKVKAQVLLDSNNELPADETTLRFVTTVDSLNYNRIAFKYQVEKKDGTFTGTYDSYASYEDKTLANKVYTKLYYVGTSDGDAMEYKPNAFTWKSMYFKAWNLTGIKANQYGRMIKITPYWITKDGTIVEGELRELCVNDFDASAWKKVEEVKSVTLDFLGQNTMPIGGFGLWPAADEVNGDNKLFPDYVTEQYFEMFADAGVNLLVYSGVDYNKDSDSVKKQLKYGEKYGIGVFVEDTQLLTLADSEGDLTTRLQEYAGEKAFSGIHLVDEPGVKNVWGYDNNLTAEQNKSYDLYTTLSGKLKNKYLSYSNLYPIYINYNNVMDDKWSWITSNTESGIKEKYTSYVETVSTSMQNDVLSWDFYPFEEDHLNKNGTDYDYSLYFWNMDLIRAKAINQSKPFWAVIQAGSNWNNRDKNGNLIAKSTTEYYPTQSQFNWNVNTSLAYGAKGIQYFPLVQPIQFAYDSINSDWDFERNGILSAWGGKTQWYYYAQEMNKQIAAIDEVLMNATNEGVIAS